LYYRFIYFLVFLFGLHREVHDEMEKYESLHQQEFGHTRVYNVNLLERVGMDEEPPLILQTIGWGELYRGDPMTRVMDGCLYNRANRNASIH
jgi:hypothetical protein